MIIDGKMNDWWHHYTDRFVEVAFMHILTPGGQGILFRSVAIDKSIEEFALGNKGRFILYTTKSNVVLLAARTLRHSVNATSRVAKIHKPPLAIGFKWPSESDIAKGLNA